MKPLLAGLLLLALSGVAAAAPREFTLGRHGTLSLSVPEAWGADLRGTTTPESYAVLLTPRTGSRFEVIVSIPIPPDASAKLPDSAEMRQEVTAAARDAATQSVERSLPLQALSGPEVSGYYFKATDRAPAAGEYKYMAQGLVRAGGLVLAFTILTNEGQDEVPDAALAMIRTAVHHPADAAGAAPKPAESHP